MIDFSIDGTPYQAEEGMTWEIWVGSKYNTYNSFAINPDGTIYQKPIVSETLDNCKKTDIIEANYKYQIPSQNAGGGIGGR